MIHTERSFEIGIRKKLYDKYYKELLQDFFNAESEKFSSYY